MEHVLHGVYSVDCVHLLMLAQPYTRFIGSGMIIQQNSVGCCCSDSSRVLINMVPLSGAQACFRTIGCTGVQVWCACCTCTFCFRGWITGVYN